ncbi:MAG: hypothetical protein A2Y23_12450 [Clostridiales bacterium GWB2_37_7]|nr:MAG: hypothetical protein A2Y23_12450 [Clostridiales bacterium GWB2_37_7]
MKLKLTRREKTLLTIAVLFLVAATLYYVVIKPQLDMVRNLEKQAKEYSVLIEDIKAKADLDNPLYKENRLLNAKTEALLRKYYPDIIQENIILLLDEKLKKSNIKIVSINFSLPTPYDLKSTEKEQELQESELEDLVKELYGDMTTGNKEKENMTTKEEESMLVEKMTAVLSFKGSYSQIYSFLGDIEQENKSIILRELNISSSTDNLLNCDMALDFYSIPKPFVQEGDRAEWPMKGVYGKENPF